jgi:hypothetical protein
MYNIERLGKAGESIISNYFSSQGMRVEISVNQFDSQKDMIVEGKIVEVKTQVPFVTKDSFTFKQNQLNKCVNADEVYFISVPTVRRHFSEGKVYVIKGSEIKYKKHKTKDGREMILIPINQDGMKEVFEVSEQEKKLLVQYSSSNWKS